MVNVKTYLEMQSARFRQRGLTTVEYAVAGALIAAGVAAAFILLGEEVSATLSYIISCLDGTCN